MLLAFAADRRAAVDMDRKAAAPAADVQQSIDIACPRGPWQQTRRTPRLRYKIGQTNGRTPYRCIEPAAYYASSVNIAIAESQRIELA